jgi:hypothetical protein
VTGFIYIAAVRLISVAVVALHMKEIWNTFAVVVPVANVPAALKFVLKVRMKLLVPEVVTITVKCRPVVQLLALIVSACAGVSV